MYDEKTKLACKRYREKNREKLRLAAAQYRADNPEKAKADVARYVDRNREKVRFLRRERNKKWRENNRVYFNTYFRLHNQNRRIKCNDKLSKGLIEKLMELQKGKCACCGIDITNSYHIDHIMPLSLGGKNEDCNIQLLSPSCNLSKRNKHPVDYMRSKGMLV